MDWCNGRENGENSVTDETTSKGKQSRDDLDNVSFPKRRGPKDATKMAEKVFARDRKGARRNSTLGVIQ